MDSIFALKYCIMYIGPISRVNISTMIFLPFFPFFPEFSHCFRLFISACSCFIEKSDEFLEKNAPWGLPSKFSTFGHLTTECTSFPSPRFLVRVRFFSATSGAWINKMILMKKEVDKSIPWIQNWETHLFIFHLYLTQSASPISYWEQSKWRSYFWPTKLHRTSKFRLWRQFWIGEWLLINLNVSLHMLAYNFMQMWWYTLVEMIVEIIWLVEISPFLLVSLLFLSFSCPTNFILPCTGNSCWKLINPYFLHVFFLKMGCYFTHLPASLHTQQLLVAT